MGGNALASMGAVRVNKEQYQRILGIVKVLIGSNGFEFAEIPSYRNKESFGDIDILVKVNPFNGRCRDIIVQALEGHYGRELPKIKNGKVLSIGVPLSIADDESKYLQVDFIFEDERTYEFSYKYYSWNDCGNLIGRIAYNMGLRFTHYGLIHTVLDNTNPIGTVEITTDFEKALEFLGFNSIRWSQGFNSVEEIYEFITASRYFNSSIFALENRNHTARMRDRKRPTYMGFLKYLDSGDYSKYTFEDDKKVYMNRVFEEFPKTKFQYNEILKVNDVKKKAQEKLNGTVVTGITNLTGESLGKFMKFLRMNEPFNDYVVIAGMSKKDVKLEVLKQHSMFKLENKVQ